MGKQIALPMCREEGEGFVLGYMDLIDLAVAEKIAKQVYDVCGLGTGSKTCSFLMMGAGWECAKGTGCEPTILKRRANGGMNAMGDNCSGPPDFIPATAPDPSADEDDNADNR